jgi:hypothetical protein
MPKVEFRNSWRSGTSAGTSEARGIVAAEMQPKTSTFVKFQLFFAALFRSNNPLAKQKSRRSLRFDRFLQAKVSMLKFGRLMKGPASDCSLFHRTFGSVNHRLNRLTFFKKILGIVGSSDHQHMFEPGIVGLDCQRYPESCYTEKVSRRACTPVVELSSLRPAAGPQPPS